MIQIQQRGKLFQTEEDLQSGPVWGGGNSGKVLRWGSSIWSEPWKISIYPSRFPGKLILRQWLWCRGILASGLGVPTCRRKGSQPVEKVGHGAVTTKASTESLVALKLGCPLSCSGLWQGGWVDLYTLKLFPEGGVALGSCLFIWGSSQKGWQLGVSAGSSSHSWGNKSMSQSVLKGIWLAAHHCVLKHTQRFRKKERQDPRPKERPAGRKSGSCTRNS